MYTYRCRFGYFHVFNNDYYEWEMYAIGGSENPTILSEGNRFMAPDNQGAKEVDTCNLHYAQQLKGLGCSNCLHSKFHVHQ